MLQNQAFSASVASRLKPSLSKEKAFASADDEKMLASPDFPVLSDSRLLLPVGFFEDLNWNELAILNSFKLDGCQAVSVSYKVIARPGEQTMA